MTSESTTSQPPKVGQYVGEELPTLQLLVRNEGNRRAISQMLRDDFTVITTDTVEDADLYLIEDRLFPTYRDEVRVQIEQQHPAFCPVVIIRREDTRIAIDWTDTRADGRDRPILVDEFVEAPVNRQLLCNRLRSLFIRRQQSLELLGQVSTLEQQEKDLRRFERAVANSGNAILIIDPDGIVEYANPGFEAITTADAAEAIGQPVNKFLSNESGTVFDESFWQTMAERKDWAGELNFERSTDHRCIADTTVTSISDESGTIDGFVIVMTDITQRIQRERALQDRERELDLLRQILSRYLRHNLRNDLNVIQGYAELLTGALREPHTQYAQKILDTTDRLIETSETARKYSTLVERDSELVPHDLVTLVDEIGSDIRERYPGVTLEVATPDNCRILARDGIREAIAGIVDNAAKHNDASDPWVRVQIRDMDTPEVVIEDNGPGLSELERESLEQGKETPLTHSQGIGLWFSKWLIEKVGGELLFAMTETGGTRVTVTFPPPDVVDSEGVEVSDLKAREQRLQTIIHRMTDAVLEVDGSWEITFVDEQAGEILDVDADRIRGLQFWDVFLDMCDTKFDEVYRDAMENRSSTSIEEYYPANDTWLEVYVYPDFDGGLSLYMRDVTDRREREQALKERVKELTAIQQASQMFVQVDEPMETVLEEFVGGLPQAFQYPDITAAKLAYAGYEVSTERFAPTDSRLTARATTADGTPLRIDVVYLDERPSEDDGPFLTEEQELLDILVTLASDYVERKERERRLRETSSRLEVLFDRSPDMIDVHDPEGVVVDVNRRFCDELGYDEAEVLGKHVWDIDQLVDADDVARLLSDFAPDERRKFEGQYERTDGSTFPVEVHLLRLDLLGETRFLAISRDITERKTQERNRDEIIERVTDAIVEVDADWRFTLVNEQAEDLYEMAEEELLNRNFWKVFEEAKGTRFEEEYRRVMDTREPTSFVEFFPQLDGWFDITAYPKHDGGIAFYFVEVTEQRERQLALEQTNTLLSALFETLPVGVTVLNPDGTIRRANQRAEEVLGLTATEITKRTYNDPEWRIVDEDGEPIPADDLPFSQVMDGGETVINYEHGIKWPDGRERWLSINATPLTTDDGTVEQVVTVITDITDQRDQEQALRYRNERLEEFSSIVSHDLRNPLNVAEGRLELLREECDSEHLDAVSQAHERMTVLIGDLLSLARHGSQLGDLESVHLASLIEECWRSVATAKASLTADVGRTIQADRSRLQQLLENLMQNAIQHGEENVRIGVGELDEGFYIEDDGPGIPADEREDVFEMGYTTADDGTGFGLSIVKQVAAAHGWDVRVTDGPKGGARFEITGVEFAA